MTLNIRSKRYGNNGPAPSKDPAALGNPFGTAAKSLRSGKGGGTKRRKKARKGR